MKNVTITLDEETAAWARVHAAKQNMSVSRMIGEMFVYARDATEPSNQARASTRLRPLWEAPWPNEHAGALIILSNGNSQATAWAAR